jgi:NAD(P)-dependent dehydrogenase (short-subunit alcohol dehydrogenase family)
MDFTGKRVLITGASRGIGRACARLFAERGARVAVHYQSNVEAAQYTLEALAGSGHILVQGDVGNPDEVQHIVTSTVERLTGIDVLVNNAAIYEDHPIAEVSYEQWQASWHRVIAVNLIGSANMLYCAAQHMIEQGGGRIVNISSRGAFRGEPTGPAYGASKAGLNSLGQSMAKALAPYQIFVGTIAPGFVDTDMAAEILDSPQGEFIRHESPLKRVATPEDVAYVALFLASEGAEFTTGTIIDVNGASYLRS